MNGCRSLLFEQFVKSVINWNTLTQRYWFFFVGKKSMLNHIQYVPYVYVNRFIYGIT